jgi:hypothetical protein
VKEDGEALGALYRETVDGWVGRDDGGIISSCDMHFRSLLLAKLAPEAFGPPRDEFTKKAMLFSWDVQGFMNMDGNGLPNVSSAWQKTQLLTHRQVLRLG